MLLSLRLPGMPHAIVDRPSFFPHQLPNPRTTTVSYQPSPADGRSSKLALPILSRDITPPLGINVGTSQGRMNGSQFKLHTSQRDGTGLGPRAVNHASRPSYADQPYSSDPSVHCGSKSSTAFPSPITRRPSDQPVDAIDPANAAEPPMLESLRIPRTIHTPQSDLTRLAAETTCLFWFEDSSTLEKIEDSTPHQPMPLVPDAIPSIGFQKWVTTILSTTQVTQNVVLLALQFIYRLKKVNPSVKGSPGSEFRLLTVALMLGNKFLDDNTYTNKTWAEVSGIPVKEVHIMEVEFLSNMRYSLYTSERDWKEWHAKLCKFGTYFYHASRVQETATRPRAALRGSTLIPAHHAADFASPSPPTSSLSYASPPFSSSNSPLNQTTGTHTPLMLPQISSTAVSPIGQLPELNVGATLGKRNYDEKAEEPPAKRLNSNLNPNLNLNFDSGLGGGLSRMLAHAAHPHVPQLMPQHMPQQAAALRRPPVAGASHVQLPTPLPSVAQSQSQSPSQSQPHPSSRMPRLPPALAIQTNLQPQPQSQPHPHEVAGLAQLSLHQLPPLPLPLPLPLPQPQPQPQLVPRPSPGHVQSAIPPMLPTAANPNQSFVQYADTGTGAGSRQLSPYVIASAASSSPVSATVANRLSPSYFLQQRSSPYRPVQPVHRLLNPLPISSTATTYMAPEHVPLTHMQYRPLARPMADPRVGHLPYLSHQAWPQTHQLNQWPAVSQH